MRSYPPDIHRTDETLARSAVKTVTYRLFIVILDFATIYLFTRRVSVAAGYTIVSNLYTTVAYLAHERIWDRIRWGRRIFARSSEGVVLAPSEKKDG